MQKIQVLFPEPEMRRLRVLARREDRSLSELIRRATERWLDSRPAEAEEPIRGSVPSFHGGPMLVSADRLRDEAYADTTGKVGSVRE